MPTTPAPSHRRAVFLDYDGTLAEQGVVPAAHVEAVRAVRENGHTVLLSTGRCASIVAPEVLDLLDGAVCSAGAHVRVGDALLRDERYPEDLGRRAVEALTAHEVPFVLEAPDALFCTPAMADWIRDRAEALPPAAAGTVGGGTLDLARAVRLPEDLTSCSFAKISLWRSPVTVEQLAAEIGEEIAALPSSMSRVDGSAGELFLRHLDKAGGVQLAAEHLGLGMDATVGAGDGLNDLGMLRATGTSIAIEGAPASVLEAADLVVPGPEEAGLALAFERLGLL